MQVFFDRLTTLLQVRLQNFKFFFCHDTITVVVVCTIAGAKGTTKLQLLQHVFQRMLTNNPHQRIILCRFFIE